MDGAFARADNPRMNSLRRALCASLLPIACAGAPTRHLEPHGALGPYSAAVASGELVFLSGKIARDVRELPAEVEAVFDALEAELARLSLSLADVVSVNVYLTDIERFAELNEVYARRMPRPYPARTTVGVAALPAGAHVEIQVVARRR